MDDLLERVSLDFAFMPCVTTSNCSGSSSGMRSALTSHLEIASALSV
jgi:hypothetical protein